MRAAHEGLAAGRGDRGPLPGRRAGSPPGAATARRPSSTSSTARAGSSSTRARTCSAQSRSSALVGLDLGDIIGVDGHRVRDQARRAVAAGRRLGAAGEEPAPAAGQVPRRSRTSRLRYRHRELDLIANPEARELFAMRGRGRSPRSASWLDERGLPRGRDAGAPAALRRRAGAAVHHPPQRARPRPLPADRHRALPEAAASSAGSSASTSSARTSATRASRSSTTPSSRCSSGTRPTPTTTTRPSGSSSSSPAVAERSSGRPTVERDGDEIDLAPPWRRVTLRDAIQERTGIDIARAPEPRGARRRRWAASPSPTEGWGKLVDGAALEAGRADADPADVRHRLPGRAVARSPSATAPRKGWSSAGRPFVGGVEIAQRVHRAQRPRRAAAALRAAGRGAAARRRGRAAVRRGVRRGARARDAADRRGRARASTGW